MDTIITTIISLVVASGAGAVLWRILERTLTKKLDTKMEKILEREKASLDLLRTLSQKCIDSAEILPIEIGRTRAIIKNIIARSEYDQELAVKLNTALEVLETELNRYFSVLEPRVYSSVHTYKVTVRKFLETYLSSKNKIDADLERLAILVELYRKNAIEHIRTWVHGLDAFKRLDSEIEATSSPSAQDAAWLHFDYFTWSDSYWAWSIQLGFDKAGRYLVNSRTRPIGKTWDGDLRRHVFAEDKTFLTAAELWTYLEPLLIRWRCPPDVREKLVSTPWLQARLPID